MLCSWDEPMQEEQTYIAMRKKKKTKIASRDGILKSATGVWV